jgi:hypothetical protein
MFLNYILITLCCFVVYLIIFYKSRFTSKQYDDILNITFKWFKNDIFKDEYANRLRTCWVKEFQYIDKLILVGDKTKLNSIFKDCFLSQM